MKTVAMLAEGGIGIDVIEVVLVSSELCLVSSLGGISKESNDVHPGSFCFRKFSMACLRSASSPSAK